MQTHKKFTNTLLIDSMNDVYSRNNFTVDRILNTLQRSTKIEENLEKVNAFLELKTKNGTMGNNLEKLRHVLLSELSRELYINDNETLWEMWKKERDIKLIKYGNYKLLFALNPLYVKSDYYCRSLIKIIKCDDEIKQELISLDSDEMGIYYRIFPENTHNPKIQDDLTKQFLILEGELQVWQSKNKEYTHNTYTVSIINDIYTTYFIDSKIIYPSKNEIIEYLEL